MKFDFTPSLEILGKTPFVLRSMLSGLNDLWIKSGEGENTWSPYDIVGHLIHGEKTDWIERTRIIVSHAENKTFEPFNRFAQFSDSAGKSINRLLDEFEQLRIQNLEELKQLVTEAEQFDQTGIHPEFGEVTLRQLLSTWVVHDLDHLGQIVRVMAFQYNNETGPWAAYLPILHKQPLIRT